MKIFGGIEGGASSSKLALVSSTGQLLYLELCGPSTNHWLIGRNECLKRIAEMIEKSLKKICIQSELESLCLSLSGCEDPEINEMMAKEFIQTYPSLTKHCFVSSDTLAPLYSLNYSSGIVLIAGTGSNCLLFNPDGSERRCGGWGHVIGDYGSAFWVSLEAIKTCIECEDNYLMKSIEIKTIKQIVLKEFQIENFTQILDKMYTNFDKSKIAALCLPLAQLAKSGEEISRDIFIRAGIHLGRHVKALLKAANPSLLQQEGGVPVVCVGGVFESWDLLSSGFFSVFGEKDFSEISLRKLKKSSCIGSAVYGAHRVGESIQIEDSSQLLAHFKDGKWK